MVAACSGVVMTTGSGTSGTIAATGAYARDGDALSFVHPADALHGPSASVQNGDILIAIPRRARAPKSTISYK